MRSYPLKIHQHKKYGEEMVRQRGGVRFLRPHPGSAGSFGSRIGTSSSTLAGSSIGSLPGRSAGSLTGVSGPAGWGRDGSPGRRGAGFFGMNFHRMQNTHAGHQPRQFFWGRLVPSLPHLVSNSGAPTAVLLSRRRRRRSDHSAAHAAVGAHHTRPELAHQEIRQGAHQRRGSLRAGRSGT
jgi:hypothetical protein